MMLHVSLAVAIREISLVQHYRPGASAIKRRNALTGTLCMG